MPAILVASAALVVGYVWVEGGERSGLTAVIGLLCLALAGVLAGRRSSSRAAAWGVTTSAALALVYLAFNSGGYAAGPVGGTAMVLAALLALALVVRRGTGRLDSVLIVGAAALAAYAFMQGLSVAWSNAPERALIDAGRTSTYLLLLLVGAVAASNLARLRALAAMITAALALVVLAGLAAWLAPDLLNPPEEFTTTRLSFPLGYWNGMGLMAAAAIVLSLHHARSGPAWQRVIAAGICPALAATLLFTFSRGGFVVLGIGLVVLVVLGASWPLLTAFAATVGPSVGAVAAAYGATLLADPAATQVQRTAEGHSVAGPIALWCALAAILAALLLIVERRLATRPPQWAPRPKAVRLVALAGLVAVLGAAAAAGAGTAVVERLEGFSDEGPTADRDLRARLTQFTASGRLEQYEAALDGFETQPVRGVGSGTWEFLWHQHRDTPAGVAEAHSLYVETLGELGLVGFALIVVALIALGIGLYRARTHIGDTPLLGAVAACFVMWLVHAGIEWDWELPATTAWVFPLLGGALAARTWEAEQLGSSGHAVLAVTGLALALVPAAIGIGAGAGDRAERRLADGDCLSAVDAAEKANRLLDVRPTPHAVVGICLAQEERYAEAASEIGRAVELDPESWRYHYLAGLVEGARRRDLRPPMRRAVALNPATPLMRGVRLQFLTDEPRDWRRETRRALRRLREVPE